MRLIVNSPLNSVSFGNVAYNIVRELYKKSTPIDLFPIGDRVDIGAYDKTHQGFINYLNEAVNKRLFSYSANNTCFKLWHIMGSESRLGKNQGLLTFHETSEITNIEKNILDSQDVIFVSSSFTKSVFEAKNVKNVVHVPLGFDEDFCKTGRSYLQDKIHFGLLGKLEYRKNTARIIKNWLKIFGNNPRYQLSCAISNPFLDKNVFQSEIFAILDGKHYNNINFVPSMNTNSEVNDFLNSIDIDLGGLSGSEGWNLPSFNATCLGKWSVVLNATAHKDWATQHNSILIEPSRMKEAHDGMFFVKGSPVNQGCFFDLSDEEMANAIEHSVTYAKRPNPEGEKLASQMTYRHTTETILHNLARFTP